MFKYNTLSEISQASVASVSDCIQPLIVLHSFGQHCYFLALSAFTYLLFTMLELSTDRGKNSSFLRIVYFP